MADGSSGPAEGPLHPTIARLLARCQEGMAVRRAWEALLPKNLRLQARPVGWRGQQLVVEVTNSAVLCELTNRKTTLLEALRKGVGAATVTGLELRLAAPAEGPHEDGSADGQE
mgnify:CR=1 FL=1